MTTNSQLSLHSKSTALIIVDMQNDYCSKGFYMDKAGYDIDKLRQPIMPITQVLSEARSRGLTIIFTRQYRIQDEQDASPNANVFPLTALKGEPGWEIIYELIPQDGESLVDKTTCSAFVSTNIDEILRDKGIKTVVFCGNTIDVCVHSTLRSANDLGYKCITLADCCGAVNEELHKWSIESILVEDGVFGSVASVEDFLNASWL